MGEDADTANEEALAPGDDGPTDEPRVSGAGDGADDEEERSDRATEAAADGSETEDKGSADGDGHDGSEVVADTDTGDGSDGDTDDAESDVDDTGDSEADAEPDSDGGDDSPAATINAAQATADGEPPTGMTDGTGTRGSEPTLAGESGETGYEPVAETEAALGNAADAADGVLGEGPETDQEMPLADHIEEMMRRLGVVFLFAGTATVLVYGVGQFVETVPSAIEIINYLWNHNIPGAPDITKRRPRLYGPLELILTELKVAGLAGIVVGLPAFVYQTYRFMRPGLYPHERRYYLAAVPTSLVLALVGITFANFVVVPAIFNYFTSYTQASGTVVAFGLRETFNLILVLMGYMAIVFQIPLFMMLAIMMNLTSRVWMEDRRLLFWGGFLGLAFIVSPDPTGMAPIIIGATMITLFEGTLALLRWTGN